MKGDLSRSLQKYYVPLLVFFSLVIDENKQRYVQWCPKHGRDIIRPQDAAMQLNAVRPNTFNGKILHFDQYAMQPPLAPSDLLELLRPAFEDRFGR